VGFTHDLDPLRLALSHKKVFPWLRHGAADTLLHRGEWKSRFCEGLTWSLRQGHLPEHVVKESAPPEMVFFAPLPGTDAQALRSALAGVERLF